MYIASSEVPQMRTGEENIKMVVPSRFQDKTNETILIPAISFIDMVWAIAGSSGVSFFISLRKKESRGN